ncbi:MAG TPA: CCA tRNA nucleotidyltransferase [Actinomycetes bacterium]|jgi:poly(A) polymerase|nr:CCA tRNA nucleotidyltransferase [Actinomycetes bacterium]
MSSLSPSQQQALGALLQASPFAAVARELGERFAAAGHQLYLVGGTVRDALLDRASSDVDFTTDATPDRILAIIRRWSDHVWLQGLRFGTVGVSKGGLRLEITTFRSDVYREDSRKPEVSFGRTIEEDLARRDFTVNAMAVRLPDGHFVDPSGGLADLVARRLRTPSSPAVSFEDDPLRMLRAARFYAELELVPTQETVAAIGERAGRLQIVSRERIREELTKLLLGRSPGKGLWLIVNTRLADQFLPELPALALEQDPVHRHKDVLAHTIAVVERATAFDAGQPDLVLRLAALLHDIGKPRTRRVGPDGVSFHLHEVVGAKMAERRLLELRYPNEIVQDVRQLVLLHLRFHTYRLGWSDSAVRRYVRDAGDLLDRLNFLVRSDCTTRNPFKARQLAAACDELEERIARLEAEEELARIKPPLNGEEVMAILGVPPGPVVGRALGHLLELRLDRGPLSREEATGELLTWAREQGIDVHGAGGREDVDG